MGTYIECGGVNTWYEVEGDGDPLVLLHGGMTDSRQFGLNVGALAERHRVLLPDRRGHGRTADVEGPISYEVMAADTVAFLEAVGCGPAHLVGHSDGGNVALLVALHRPDLVREVVMIGGNFAPGGLVPGALDPDEMLPFVQGAYGEVSPDGIDHLPVVIAKVARMWAEEPLLTEADLAQVSRRVLVMVGDDDAVTLEHTVALYRGLSGSELAVVPGTSHLLPLEKPDLVNRLILDFVGADPPATFLPLRRAAG